MFHIKRLKPFALLISMCCCFALYTLTSVFFLNYENKELFIRNLLRPQRAENDGVHVDLKKQLELLRKSFEKSLERYENSTRNFGKKFKNDHVLNTSFHKLESHRDVLKQNFVCNNRLFLLIQVHSSPKNFMSRQAIRLSWGNMEHFIGNHGKEKKEINDTMR